MKYLLAGLLLCYPMASSFSETRTNNLPQQIKWRYITDEKSPVPRSGQFWRDGIFIEDKIIVLNSYYLIALDINGKQLWIRSLPSENAYAQAKIHNIGNKEIIVVTSDSIFKINIETGELVDHYTYDVSKKSAFQTTELMPRFSILLENNMYVFLGPQLLQFNVNSLEKSIVLNLNSSPKTKPIIYKDHLVVGLENQTAVMINIDKKTVQTILTSFRYSEESIRQPVVIKNYLLLPTTTSIYTYNNYELVNETSKYSNAILSIINDNIWMRQHCTGKLSLIDETFSTIASIIYETPKYAGQINSPLIGISNKLIHFDNIKGQIIFFDVNNNNISIEKELFAEDLLDNPPLQFLDQQENLFLIGGFDGLLLGVIE